MTETRDDITLPRLTHWLRHHPEATIVPDGIADAATRERLEEAFEKSRLGLPNALSSDIVAEKGFQRDLFTDYSDIPYPAPSHPQFTFVDLFAGIGGIRIPYDELGGDCVFSSE